MKRMQNINRKTGIGSQPNTTVGQTLKNKTGIGSHFAQPASQPAGQAYYWGMALSCPYVYNHTYPAYRIYPT